MRIRNLAIISCFAIGLSFSFNVSALSLTDAFKAIHAAAKKSVKAICKKGNFFGGEFSIRSFEGVLCKNKIMARIALGVCAKGDVDNFNKSKCAEYAREAVKKEKLTSEEKKNITKIVPEEEIDFDAIGDEA